VTARALQLWAHPLPILALLMLVACATQPAAGCSARVLITLAEPSPGRPDDAFVTALERSAQGRLTFVRTVGPGILLFDLKTQNSEPVCDDALDRLRKDSRVRSADLDVARRHH
jgi:hypothetical protein